MWYIKGGTFKVVRLTRADRLRNEKFFSDVCAFTWGSMWCIYFLIIMFGHASTSGSMFIFSLSCKRAEGLGGGPIQYTFHVLEEWLLNGVYVIS